MGKDNKGKELGTHFYQRKDGRYEARATINGVKISIYGRNLRELRKQFEEQKELAENRIEARKKELHSMNGLRSGLSHIRSLISRKPAYFQCEESITTPLVSTWGI